MLVEINSSNLYDAYKLLARVFTRCSPEFWVQALSRLVNFSGNKTAKVPIGYILYAEGKPSGVVLTIATRRRGSDGTLRRYINVANWYIEPGQRWLAPLMMRAILSDPDAIYTDVSPVPHVEKMLKHLGFERLNDGQAIIPTPYAALDSVGSGQIHDFNSVSDNAIDPDLRSLMLEHTKLECRAVCLVENDCVIPLLFKFVEKFRLPIAELVYCGNNAAMIRNLARVSRYLLGEGRLLMRMDIPRHGTVPGFKRRGIALKYARGKITRDGTDYLGTEFSLFDFTRLHSPPETGIDLQTGLTSL